MGGGVNPIEWVLPPVALTHMAVNSTLQSVSPRAKIITPGSPIDRQQKLGAAEAQQAADQRSDATRKAAQYLAANPLPQTPEEELAARRRGEAAGTGRYGGKRASAYLASESRALGVAV